MSRKTELRNATRSHGLGSLLTVRQAAEYLSVSRRWLEGNPDIPVVDLARAGRVRRMVRYRVEDLDAFAYARRISLRDGDER